MCYDAEEVGPGERLVCRSSLENISKRKSLAGQARVDEGHDDGDEHGFDGQSHQKHLRVQFKIHVVRTDPGRKNSEKLPGNKR